MSYSTIYDMRTADVLEDGVQSQAVCDATLTKARNWARDLQRSVVVEDGGTEQVYRVTPAGHVWRAPRTWGPPTWAGEE